MSVFSRLARLLPAREQRSDILDSYVHTAPSAQNAVDIFKGEWSSRLPLEVESGGIDLFSNPGVEWAARELQGLEGKTVLDLGPLEGGHAYMFERMGAAEVISVEANTRAYLKCLITKELLGLKRTSFLCGDFIEYLRGCDRQFDFVNASGVLYHMREPAELIARICRAGRAAYVWTQCYDEEIVSANPRRKGTFAIAEQAQF